MSEFVQSLMPVSIYRRQFVIWMRRQPTCEADSELIKLLARSELGQPVKKSRSEREFSELVDFQVELGDKDYCKLDSAVSRRRSNTILHVCLQVYVCSSCPFAAC